MSRFPKFPRDDSGGGSPRGIRLVVAPEVTPAPPRELRFRTSLVIALVFLGVLAFGATKWLFPILVPPAPEEPLVISLQNGESMEEPAEAATEAPERLPVPPVTPAAAAPPAPPMMVQPVLPVPEELPFEAMEVVAESVPESFEPLFEEVAKPQPRKARPAPERPTSASRPSRPRAVTSEDARLTRRVAPAYPYSARRAGVEGRVTLLLTVGTDGRVSAARVQSSSGSRALDEAALQASRKWTFSPATRGGQPVVSQVPAPFSFRLK